MAIFKGSRYENVPVYRQYNGDQMGKPNDARGLMVPTLRRRDLTTFHATEAIIHTFQKSDRIDLLAYKYYGDSQLWWAIMDANPRYMTPWDIPVGANLTIPPLNSFTEGSDL